MVPVGELRGAWLALATGMFEGPSLRWRDLGAPVVVVGAHGGSGASTTALAIAEATGAAHLLELAGPGQSGLVAAATAEFGEVGPGWVRGRRGVVVIDHLARWPDGSLIPAPAPVRAGSCWWSTSRWWRPASGACEPLGNCSSGRCWWW